MDRITMDFLGEDDERIEVSITGDGSLNHYVDTFRAFLMASGIHPADISKLLGDIDCDMDAEFFQRDQDEEVDRLKAFDQRMGYR